MRVILFILCATALLGTAAPQVFAADAIKSNSIVPYDAGPLKLQIAIPDSAEPGGELKSINLCTKQSDGTLSCDGISHYIGTLYKWLVIAGSILAVLYIMVGGLQYLTAGGSGRGQQGQKMMTDALTGLALLLGSYVILYTINPQLVALNPLNLELIGHQKAELVALQNQYDLSQESNPAIGKTAAEISTNICGNASLVSTYKAAAERNDLPWQMLAAIHYRERENSTTASNPMQFDATAGNSYASKPECLVWPTALDCAAKNLKGSGVPLTATTTDPALIKRALARYNCGTQAYCQDGNYFYVSNNPPEPPGPVYHIKGTIGNGKYIDQPDTRPGAFIIYSALQSCSSTSTIAPRGGFNGGALPSEPIH